MRAWVLKIVIDDTMVMLERLLISRIFQRISQILELQCFIKILFIFSHFFVFSFLKTSIEYKTFYF